MVRVSVVYDDSYTDFEFISKLIRTENLIYHTQDVHITQIIVCILKELLSFIRLLHHG